MPLVPFGDPRKALIPLIALLVILFFLFLLPPPVPPAHISDSFLYPFTWSGVLNEADAMDDTRSPYFWLNSGGRLLIGGGFGQTMQGDAPPIDHWRQLYAAHNASDTDDGLHPQNLFRLVTRSTWDNLDQEMGFYIIGDNFSASGNRNASNGLLLMNRYASNGETLYYAGIRVDGTAVIKKKYEGTYYTMAQKNIFSGVYNGYRDTVNLIPHDEWLTLRDTTVTNADGSVTITLFMMSPGADSWTELLSANDSGEYAGTPPLGTGYAGIRTDFMDVDFRDYRLSEI